MPVSKIINGPNKFNCCADDNAVTKPMDNILMIIIIWFWYTYINVLYSLRIYVCLCFICLCVSVYGVHSYGSLHDHELSHGMTKNRARVHDRNINRQKQPTSAIVLQDDVCYVFIYFDVCMSWWVYKMCIITVRCIKSNNITARFITILFCKNLMVWKWLIRITRLLDNRWNILTLCLL